MGGFVTNLDDYGLWVKVAEGDIDFLVQEFGNEFGWDHGVMLLSMSWSVATLLSSR